MDRADINKREGREPLIPKHGGYRRLKTFQLTQLIYDVMIRFCDRNIDRRSRTHDQMVQAARSGVQNIAEGSQASGTSKRTEMKLTNVARASLEELRCDFIDFLRQRGMKQWDKNDPRRKALVARRCATADDVARWVKEVYEAEHGRDGRNGQNGQNGQTGPRGRSIGSIQSISSMKSIPSIQPKQPIRSKQYYYAEISANAALVLIEVAVALLDRQLQAQAKAFEREGGFTERLYRTRTSRRRGQ